ncbi:MAG: class I SAM-dependent methyltransferase [Parvimonas sp.]|nr:class I SAM-dependent methyltransferase [Parvimonas sp.]
MYDKFSYIYDELMKRQVDYDLLASNVIQICINNNVEVRNILECGMGSGNLTEQFLKRGIYVDGFDISDNMLSIAYNKLILYDNINILKGDIRTFDSNRKYNLICCFFDVLNYLKNINEIDMFLNNCKNQMDENSILMFDINSEYKLREYLGNNIFVDEEDELFYVWRNYLHNKYIDFDIDFFLKTENGTYEKIKEIQRQYIYSENDILNVIKKNNFQIIEIIDFENFKNKTDKTFRTLYVLKI